MSDATVEVKIEGDAINQMIAQAILDSTIGIHINKAMDEAVEKFRKGYQMERFIESCIDQEIKSLVRKEIQTNEMQATILAKLNNEGTMKKVSDAFVNKFIDKMDLW